MAKRSYSQGTPEQMLAAFQNKISELGGDVSACSSVNATQWVDSDGLFGEPGATIDDNMIREYWDKEHLNDPSLSYYGEDGFEAWYRDTKQWLTPVNSETSVVGGPAEGEKYVSIEDDPTFTDRYTHTLIGDVDEKLIEARVFDSWTWDADEDKLILTTIDGSEVKEYEIPRDDLTQEFNTLEQDVQYILNAVFNDDSVDNPRHSDNVNSSYDIEGSKHWDEIAEQYLHEMQAVNIDISDKPAVLNELMNNFGFTQEEAEGLFIRINECNGDLSHQDITSSESLSDNMIPSPYDNYYEVQELSEEELDGMYQVGDEIDGYECHVVAYLIVKPEFEDSMPNDAVLVDDEEYPVVELAGGRIYPIEVPAEQYTFIKSKQVEDSDGFMTDYTMYYDTENDRYVFVFGDNEVYKPEDEDFDYECETEEQANEWFDSYDGFAEDDNEDPEDEFGEW